jgi:hypothetical protein
MSTEVRIESWSKAVAGIAGFLSVRIELKSMPRKNLLNTIKNLRTVADDMERWLAETGAEELRARALKAHREGA